MESRAVAFEDVERAFVRAASDPAFWPSAMDVAARASGSVGAIMIPGIGRQQGFPGSTQLLPVIDHYIAEGWSENDFRNRGVPIMLQKGITVDLDFATEDEILTHPYWRGFLSKFNLRWFAGILLRVGEDVWCLSLQRSADQEPFSLDEQAELRKWGPRLSTILSLGQEIAKARLNGAR